MTVTDKGRRRAKRTAPTRTAEVPLHRAIYEHLLREIEDGTWRVDERLPSEAVLCERFKASRITVAKAIGQLQREGRVRRRAGSGTFVQQPTGPATAGMRFGLLIPDLGLTEIFEPICHGMMTSPLARLHSLTWGHAPEDAASAEVVAEDLCRQFIAQKVDGVFFAPLEFLPADSYAANLRVVEALSRAGIPVILLDRGVEEFPGRGQFDLIGIDNHRAGATVTQHLLDAGSVRPVFLARAGAGSTVTMRCAGYFTALRGAGLPFAGAQVWGDPDDGAWLDAVLAAEQPDALVCANDRIAASVMRHLLQRGVQVPQDIRMTGVDDVKYAQFLPVALTTIHQNCAEMGRIAMAVMLARIENPTRASVEVLAGFELVVRESSGAL